MSDAKAVEAKAARIKDWVTNKLRELEEQNAHLKAQNAKASDQVTKKTFLRPFSKSLTYVFFALTDGTLKEPFGTVTRIQRCHRNVHGKKHQGENRKHG